MPSKRFSITDTDKYIDYDTFLSKDFDADTYATSVIETSENTDDPTDIGVELSKLAFSIDIVNKQIQEQVVANYESLLSQVIGIKELETVLNTVQTNITSLNQSLLLLSSKIKDPYLQLLEYTRQLENLQLTCELLRKLHRFMLLRRRLEAQITERDITNAALTLDKIQVITDETDFEGIDIVTSELVFITQTRQQVVEEALVLLKEGIETQNQTKIASGLQVFYNLKEMSERVQTTVNGMLEDVLKEIKKAADLQDVQKVLKKNNAASQQGATSPNMSVRLSQKEVASAVWTRMENMMQNMSDQCIKIYSLEKVLKLKKDPLTHMSFLEEIAKIFDATSLVSYFWRVLSATFEKELIQAAKRSPFIQNIFVSDYSRLLKLLNDFFSRVALHNGTPLTDYSQTPEYVIMLRSFNTFQNSLISNK